MKASLFSHRHKRPVNHDQSIQQLGERLVKQAQHWIDTPPPSVIDKPYLPPSGDRQDFASLATYWWPDPSRPGGLPYIRRDGEVFPEVARTDRGAIDMLSQAVSELTMAWRLTGEVQYVDAAHAYLGVWFVNPQTRMNPHLRYAQQIRGACEGRCIGIVDTAALTKVTACAESLHATGVLDPSLHASMQDWFSQFLDWLLESELGIEEAAQHNNHSVQYDHQVASYARFSERDSLAYQVLESFAERRVFAQIEADGSMPHELARTRSWDYTLFNLHHFLALLALGQDLGLSFSNHGSATHDRVLRAVEFFLDAGGVAGSWPYEQIVDHDHVKAVDVLIQAYRVSGKSCYADLAWSLAKSGQALNAYGLVLVYQESGSSV